MFTDEKTYEILQFLNSLIANDKTDDFRTLYMEALLELKNRTAKTAESEKQKALFVGNLILRLGKSKIRLFALERLNRVLNNHTEQDYRPMQQVGTAKNVFLVRIRKARKFGSARVVWKKDV